MARHAPITTPGPLFTTSGTYGEIVAAISDRDGHTIALIVTGRNYDVAGHLHVSEAIVRMPLTAATRLHRALGELLAEASVRAAQEDRVQPGLWSNSTIEAEAQRFGRRAS